MFEWNEDITFHFPEVCLISGQETSTVKSKFLHRLLLRMKLFGKPSSFGGSLLISGQATFSAEGSPSGSQILWLSGSTPSLRLRGSPSHGNVCHERDW